MRVVRDPLKRIARGRNDVERRRIPITDVGCDLVEVCGKFFDSDA
jgi:hypothetical protein